MTLYQYPSKTKFGRIIPKQKIYENTKVSSFVKNLFSKQLKRIRWLNKLSQDTLNINKTNMIFEIVIIQLDLLVSNISRDILSTIDKSIPLPIIFELNYDSKIKVMAIYKIPSKYDKNKWFMQGSYLSSEWVSVTTEREELPIASDLEQLYSTFIKELLPIKNKKSRLCNIEILESNIEILEKIKRLEKKKFRLELKLKTEKQFKFKIEINKEIKILESEIKILESELIL